MVVQTCTFITDAVRTLIRRQNRFAITLSSYVSILFKKRVSFCAKLKLHFSENMERYELSNFQYRRVVVGDTKVCVNR